MLEKAYSERASGARGFIHQVGEKRLFEIENLLAGGLWPSKCAKCCDHSILMIREHVKLGWFGGFRGQGQVGWTLQQNAVTEQCCDDLEIVY